jgi:Ca-activated chloride channel family protein
MKNDERISPNLGSSRFSNFRQSSKFQLFLALTIIAAIFLASCAKDKRGGEVVYNNQETPDVLTDKSMNANTSAGTMARPSATPVPGEEEAPFNTEGYSHIDENPFLDVAHAPLSTFSVDVDTASYSNTRRFLKDGQLPPKDAVRIEELINYFSYDYPQPVGNAPFSVTAEISEAPWNTQHRLVHIGLQGKRIPMENLPPANLVFLIDVSGSMNEPNKLPLVQSSLKMLTEQLSARDHVAMVVYAGTSGLVLPSTPGDRKGEILAAIDRLEAGGSTNGGEGIQLAYKIAQENFIKNGTNRVILATDGDFNVGVTSEGDLVRLIEEKRQSGVFLSVLGFGTGNVKDSTMEKLADKGNGNYAYIDTLGEARKVLGEQIGGTLFTIAKDVKIQVEFNPRQVAAYRLIGYENRLLRDRDFNDDTKDAGEIGAGHTVTALYEIVPFGQKYENPGIDPLKYQQPTQASEMANSNEMMTVKLRYKEPSADQSKLISVSLADSQAKLDSASANFKFSSAVAAFGMLLRDSKYKADASYNKVLDLARNSLGADPQGYRSEFIQLVETARTLSAHRAAND